MQPSSKLVKMDFIYVAPVSRSVGYDNIVLTEVFSVSFKKRSWWQFGLLYFLIQIQYIWLSCRIEPISGDLGEYNVIIKETNVWSSKNKTQVVINCIFSSIMKRSLANTSRTLVSNDFYCLLTMFGCLCGMLVHATMLWDNFTLDHKWHTGKMKSLNTQAKLSWMSQW